jgi:hypothetical protein
MRIRTGVWLNWSLREGHATAGSTERLVVFDVARAIGMLFVCTNHFVNVYAHPVHSAITPDNPPSLMIINAICRVASPLFVLTSGMLVGYFHTARAEDFPRLRLHFIDRAIFLATIGHLLIAIAFTPQVGFFNALRLGYMTDTLAFCTMLGFLVLCFIPRITPRLWFGVAVYILGWLAWYFWHPDGQGALIFRGIFLGPDDNGNTIFYDPLVLWFGLYLIGTCTGSWLSSYKREMLYLAGKRLGITSAIVATVTAAIALPTYVLGKYGFIEIPPYLYALGKKYPPGLVYLSLWGSAAFSLIGALMFYLHGNKGRVFRSIMESIGRNSFPLFVTQYFVYYGALFLLVTRIFVPSVPVAVVLYFGSLSVIVLAGLAFDRFRVKRFWTVGFPAVVNRWSNPNSRREFAGNVIPLEQARDTIGPPLHPKLE